MSSACGITVSITPPCQGIVPTDKEYGDMIIEEPPEDNTHNNLDKYLHAQLLLDVRGEQLQDNVIKHAWDHNGTKKGRAHRNPIFDIYEHTLWNSRMVQ